MSEKTYVFPEGNGSSLDPFSEEVAYISGGIAGEIYDAFKDIICLRCR